MSIEIKVNGETRQVEPGVSVAALLAQLGIEPRHLAVEHNGEFIGEDEFAAATLSAGDRLEIVRFVGGG